jgi:hypothetical protein
MALISVSVSKKYGSTVTVNEWDPENPNILSVDLKTYLKPVYDDSEPILYEHTTVSFHGNDFWDLFALADRLNNALYKELERRQAEAKVSEQQRMAALAKAPKERR